MAELGAPPARGGTQKHPKLRRVRRLCVWSLVIAAVVIVVVNLTVARLPTMPSADGKYISLRGKEIHYVEQPGQGVPVVLLHGQPGTYKDFEKVTPELPGLHLISIDRPGYGWSRGGRCPIRTKSIWWTSCWRSQTRPGDSGGSRSAAASRSVLRGDTRRMWRK